MLPFSRLSGFILLASYQVRASSIDPTTYTASGAFPTSLYGTYWNDPTATSAQPQPVITDPVTNEIFPYELTDPANFPKATPSQLMEQALAQIMAIASNPVFGDDTCTKCQASLAVAKMLVLGAPEQGPLLAEAVCQYFDYSTTCYDEYSELALGSTFSQVLAFANAGGYDGQNLCSHIGLCTVPPAVPLNMTGWFAKPKPNPLPPPIQPSGERLKVFHISDIHLDPRYAIGSEANCSAYMCCRENAFNAATPDQIVLPAARFGSYWCDSPLDLMAAAMESIGPLTGTEQSGFNFSLFTGDLTAHDSDNQYSRFVVFYGLLRKFVGPAPVYATIGNHDTYMQFQMIPYTTGGPLGMQFNWLYEHISSMWQYEGWLPEATVAYASTHYAAYAVTRPDGLKIISLDTNLWYTYVDNYYSYINSTEPDPYGILQFLTDELQASEDAGERVWITGHVLSGWDGTAAQVNPTNLYIFYGHTHEDQLSIFYANNGTVMTAETALTASWIGPSLTPLTNLNSGFRVYVSNVNEYPALDDQTEVGPSYYLEYSTRDAYGGNITWGANDPLNATWWHLVTEQMQADPTLVQTFNTYQSKSSVAGLNCTGECIPAKICYMRSGSSSLAYQNCPAGYSSTQ
ncbi:sphingomyelin phosphodiesterase [Suillus subaureus]|uniref:Sphingomyelin phosphodiesterase n=1 Tax=Suillus subaureus TaxID=48587 RepID=A0A9P7ECQ6_9AGAM|nr:sphingomyelin phosphodiesterase [Suillus subaureus]KAG1817992.1 sphingomyelin phosphodiesterase [Suillus subaureus]